MRYLTPQEVQYEHESYSNKSRGIREKALKAALAPKPTQTLARQQLQTRLVWASLIPRDRPERNILSFCHSRHLQAPDWRARMPTRE